MDDLNLFLRKRGPLKQFFFSALLLVFTSAVSGQQDTTAPYKKYPTFPPIELVKMNNQPFTKKDIKSNQASLIFYFSPECDHCRKQMDDMVKRMDDFKKIQIVMVTYQPMDQLVKFYNDYKLAKYQNIQAGRDTKFLLPPYYRIRSLPYLALYDKKGNLIRTYEGNVKVETLLKDYSKKS